MKWINFLRVTVRFELHGNIYGLIWNWRDGFEIVRLDADVDRPFVLDVIYSGVDMHAASEAIKALGG